MSTDRDQKWFEVPPGTVIPAGQPYAKDFSSTEASGSQIWGEFMNPGDVTVSPRPGVVWYVDRTWKKALPKMPTWGLASTRLIPEWRVGKWYLSDDGHRLINAMDGKAGPWVHSDVKFIELTPEQIDVVESRKPRQRPPRTLASSAIRYG